MNKDSFESEIAETKEEYPNIKIVWIGTKADAALPGNLELFRALAAKVEGIFITSSKTRMNTVELLSSLEMILPNSQIVFGATIRKLIPGTAVRAALETLQRLIRNLPEKLQQQVGTEAEELVETLSSRSNFNVKAAAITNFQQNCNDLMKDSTTVRILKTVADVAIVAAIALIAASILCGIGLAAGLSVGVGMFISCTLGTFAVAEGVVATAGLGVFAPPVNLSFFQPSEASLAVNDVAVVANLVTRQSGLQ